MKKFTGDKGELRYAYSTEIRVRYGETDAMGYVYYGTYPMYFEVGRNEMMRHHGFAYGRLEAEGVMMPVVDMYARYITPSHYDDVLRITTGILALHGASIDIGYVIERESDGASIVWGWTTLAFVDSVSRRPVRTPASVLSRLKE